MKNKLYKIDRKLEFNSKRNYKLITPCCRKSNKDGKFSNYKGYPDHFGYCHSCGYVNLPPIHYKDDKGLEYVWNDNEKRYDLIDGHMSDNVVLQLSVNSVGQCQTLIENVEKEPKYIDKSLVLRFNSNRPENNLLSYIRRTYGNLKTEYVKQKYYIGTSKDGGTIFWNINKDQKVQKAKVSYYTLEGKRTDKFKVPFKNVDGYFGCLFGEHLISEKENIDKKIVLVESEKTAIICALHIPEYVWLAYGGINGLTDAKIGVLRGRKIILVPDLSENAVNIMNDKLPYLKSLGIEAKVWDMRNGKSDDQLKNEGWYNCDLEDVFRVFQNFS